MSDEEDDYMSDKFLSGSMDSDIRPGLIKSHSDKRSFQALKRKRELDELNKKRNPNIKVLEHEKRKEGMEKPIEESNKGFALLKKMGYKPGQSIGKSEQGRSEPIPIELKSNREGLGRSQLRKDIQMNQLRKTSSNNVSPNEYRARIVEQNLLRQVSSDLRKSQKACENLDAGNDISEPIERWYWLSKDVEDEKEYNQKSSQKMKKNENYLRSMPNHSEFDSSDENDYSSEEDSPVHDEERGVSEEEASQALSDEDKLKNITSYLREKYFYCIWCSVKYDDESDMTQNCPGSTFQDH